MPSSCSANVSASPVKRAEDFVQRLARPHFPPALSGTWQQLPLHHHPRTLPPQSLEKTKSSGGQSDSRVSPCGQGRNNTYGLRNPRFHFKENQRHLHNRTLGTRTKGQIWNGIVQRRRVPCFSARSDEQNSMPTVCVKTLPPVAALLNDQPRLNLTYPQQPHKGTNGSRRKAQVSLGSGGSGCCVPQRFGARPSFFPSGAFRMDTAAPLSPLGSSLASLSSCPPHPFFFF
nr:uncharacterized protein LOC108177130 isoform X1 [Oryctolagus cuniculus]